MRKRIKKVLINGYGDTGSGALLDCLSDYNVSVVPNEFDDFRVPNGFWDRVQKKITQLRGGKPESFSQLAEFEINDQPISKRNKGVFFIPSMLLRAIHIPLPFTKFSNKSISYRKFFFSLFIKLCKEFFVMKKFDKKITQAKKSK